MEIIRNALTREYHDGDLPIVRRRLCRAGLRLAMVLNEAFAEK